TVQVELEVEVRTRGEPCRAHVADHVALADADAGSDPGSDSPQVGIPATIAAVVSDLDHIAVSSTIPSDPDDPVTDRPHRGSGGGGIVDSIVSAVDLEDRMESTPGEGRADPAIFQ